MRTIYKTIAFISVLMFAAMTSSGQGTLIPPKTVFGTVSGLTHPIANATITVCAANSAGLPCSPALVSVLFKDAALTQPLANPFTTDANGNYQFATGAGSFTVTETAASFAGYSYQLTQGTIGGNAATATALQNTPSQCIAQAAQGIDVHGNAVGCFSPTAAAGGSTTQAQVNNASALAGTACLNFPSLSTGPNNNDCDTRFKGPNPYADVTRYGVRTANPSVAPQTTGVTGNCIATLNTITISNASTFQPGDGFVAYGCGAPHSMTTPTAPTVTPSLPTTATLLPLMVVNGPIGAATYNYKIVARDKNGGLTAASPVGSTASGQSSLGAQSVSITSLTRNAGTNIVNVVTASAHSLTAGAKFKIGGTTNDPLFFGHYNVTNVVDSTHFSYTTGVWNYSSVAQVATGGTLAWFGCNHVTWSAVTGAWEYYIYGDRAVPGTFALLGVSRPVIAGVNDQEWDDYGSPYMDNIKLPPFVPTTAPSVATSDHLVTTITAGAGTTTLTLAASAGTSVTGATTLFDNCPNLKTAATTNSSGGPIFFPAGANYYVINSFCDLTGLNDVFMQGGNLYLNDTLELGGTRWYGDRLPSVGSGPSFTWNGGATIIVNSANPGIYLPSANATLFDHITVTLTANAAIGMMIEAGNGVSFENDSFGSSNVNDYAGIGLMFRGAEDGVSGPGSVFGIYFNKVTFAATQSVTTDTPMFYCRACGTGVFRSLSGGGRGLAFTGQSISGAGPFIFDGAFHYQAGNAPLIMNSPASNNQGAASFYLQNITLDTMANPMFSSLGAGAGGVRITGGAPPTAGLPTFTGLPLAYITADWSAPVTGQNMNVTVLSGQGISLTGTQSASVQNPSGGISVAGVAGMGYQFPQPAAPTVVLGGSGSCSVNCIPAGTYFYGISANDVNSGYTVVSPASASVTTDGTKTITVSWTPLNGQISTNRCKGISATSLTCDHVLGGGSPGTSYADTSLVLYTVSAPAVTTGFSEGLSTQGFAGHQATLVDPNSAFKAALAPATFTANHNQTFPDVNGYVPVSSYLNSAYDNANRANGAIGSNWTVVAGGINVSSNQFVGTSGTQNMAFWNLNPFSADQFAQVTLVTAPGASDFPGAAVRIQPAADSAYSCIESSTALFLQKRNAGGSTTLSTTAITAAAGDVLRMEAQGTNLTCWRNGVAALTASDATWGTGNVGMMPYRNVVTLDNWSGGNLHPIAHLDVEQDVTQSQHITQALTVGPTNPNPGSLTPGTIYAQNVVVNGTPLAGGFTAVNVTPVTANANVTTDQNGQFVTITAGTLNLLNRTLLVQMAGVYSTAAASTAVITDKIKLCTVSGCGSGTVITLATWTTPALGAITATNNPYNATINFSTQTAGASAAFESHGNLVIDLAAAAAAAESIFADNNTATIGTIDSTATLFLQHTRAFSAASGSNSFTDRQLIADTVD